jgi:hypothetical protein
MDSNGRWIGTIGSMKVSAVIEMLLDRAGPTGRPIFFKGCDGALSPLGAGRRPDCPVRGSNG